MAKVPVNVVLQPAFDAVESLGFPRWRRSTYFIRGTGKIRAYVSLLDDRVREDRMNILCHTQVNHADVQRMHMEVAGLKFRGPLPIVGGNLRFLIPEKRDYGFWDSGAVYRIPRDECPPAFVEQLRSDLSTYGIPFLDRYMTEESILDCLLNNPMRSYYREFTLPFLLHLMGRSEEAAVLVREDQRKMKRIPAEAPIHVHQRRMLELFEAGQRG